MGQRPGKGMGRGPGHGMGGDSIPAPTADQPSADGGTCDLCAEPLSSRHRHLVELDEHSLLCACRACSLLFDREAAGGDHYRLVPDRVRVLEDFRLREQDWSALGIPVELAFFFRSSDLERIVAFYPGPMGATESQLGLDRWERLESENPALRRLEDDVEALLVDRRDEERPEGWIVPIDECYRLAGLMRQHWKGLAGGTEVWERIEEFFENLQRRAGRRSG